MNKKLIAAAVAAVVAAPMAVAADTTVYGKVHVSIDMVDTTSSDNFQVNDRGSRLGFKGSEDLGNGLKAIWQYEMVYDIEGGAPLPGARNSYLGLAGDWGQVRVGRHDTPAKIALYATGVEMMGDTVMQFTDSGDGGMLNMQETRAANAIAYVSPKFSGFSAVAAIVPGEGTSAAGNDGLADAYSLGVGYSGGGFKFGFGYEDLDDLNGADTGYVNYNIGGSYSMDAFTVGLLYQAQEDAATDLESEMYALTGKYKFGNNEVVASYGNSENDGTGVANQSGDSYGIGFNHKLSKRTKLYAAYVSKSHDGADFASVAGDTFNDGDEFSIGMFHKF